MLFWENLFIFRINSIAAVQQQSDLTARRARNFEPVQLYFSGRAGFLALGFLAKQLGKRIPVPTGPYCARKCGVSTHVNFGKVFHRPTFCRRNNHQEQVEFTARPLHLRPLHVADFFGIALHFETGGETNNRPTRTHCARGARKSVLYSCSLGELIFRINSYTTSSPAPTRVDCARTC